MAQSFVLKKANFIARIQPQVVALMTIADQLGALAAEFSNEQYGSGGTNAFTDVDVQAALPASTAALLFAAMGALSNNGAVLPTIAANRQALESFRP